MARLIDTVFSDVVRPKKDAEFNRWYTTVYLPDVCAVPGVLRVKRFRMSEVTSAFDGRFRLTGTVSSDPAPVAVYCEEI